MLLECDKLQDNSSGIAENWLKKVLKYGVSAESCVVFRAILQKK